MTDETKTAEDVRGEVGKALAAIGQQDEVLAVERDLEVAAHSGPLARGRFSGYLTLANLVEVTALVKDMVGQGQPYTWVACNEGLRSYWPEVRTGQVATKVIGEIKSDGEGRYGHLTVCDSYGVWGLTTSFADDEAVRGAEPGWGRAFLTIKPGRIEIDRMTMSGSRLYWVVALEGRDDR
jgi:hypothetical protein